MKRRLMIARALVHQPRLLILDEPTAGVDIELRRSMYDFLKKINEAGTTIILTTHYLEEAENLCRNIAIIDRGIIIANTSVRELINKLDTETFIFYIKEPLTVAPPINAYRVALADSFTLEIEVEKKTPINDIFMQLSKNNIEVLSFRNKTNRLEEMFIRLINNKE
jgi:ABC-2 type transport system ATP-binding protein